MISEMFWQTVLAYAAVFLASLWLARRIYRTIASGLSANRSGGAAGCAGCPKQQSTAKPMNIRPLVQIGPKVPASQRPSDPNG